ncbi:hypothetical protein BTA51_26470 [Hahella sp. CCB-MM4]|nr:hypothetical protein BTA51_26470 [Hahella sp. CCB-MM4]
MAILTLISAACIMSGCGGDNSNENDVLSPTQIRSIELAQSHVIPPSGLSWDIKYSGDLKLVENRDTLILVTFEESVQAAKIQLFDEKHQLVSSLDLSQPKDLPETEGGDAPYSDNAWSTLIPAEDIFKGVKIGVVAQGRAESISITPALHPEMEVIIQSLPFLIYGVNDSNNPFDIEDLKIMFANPMNAGQVSSGLPFSRSYIINHPFREFRSDYLIVPPSGVAPAKKVVSASDPRAAKPILDMVWQIQNATGDMALNKITYAPSVLIDHTKAGENKVKGLRGGVSYQGSGASMGDPAIGLLWHEGGHALGLSHSIDEYKKTGGPFYPYVDGSLKGSNWGYDSFMGYFRSPLIPPTSPHFICRDEWKGAFFQRNSEGRCYRFDPMHSADDQKDPGAALALFSDFYAGKMQKWGLNHSRMNSSNDGFQKVNSQGEWEDFIPKTENYAQRYIKGQHPVTFNKTTDFIMFTYSFAGTAEVSQFYEPIRYVGNAIEYVDAVSQEDLDKIDTDTSKTDKPEYLNYCRFRGCDFTLKVTYEDGSTLYRVVKESARKTWQQTVWKDNYLNENSEDSFKLWSVALVAPDGAPKITKLELLDTPMLWNLSPTDIMAAKAVIEKDL